MSLTHLTAFVNYFVVPIFAFATAGIFMLNLDPVTIFEGISLAVICGLVLGKFAGIFVFSWLAIILRLAPKPKNSSWMMLAAISMLGGIGFTVSLFIATLSFGGAGQESLLDHAKLGIVVGSLTAGLLGFLWLHKVLPKGCADPEDDCDE